MGPGTGAEPAGATGFRYALVRPDGVIAWVGADRPDPAGWPIDVPVEAFGIR
ncbi:hypothetical protein [Tsukamurella soli]|uniref:Uncharacterized protein n=1 Tax=Tsukamurella soli TaxID=644556 RepID=A0ABP8JPX0_9ACTN